MTISLLAATEQHSPFVGFLGRLHPGIIHFPIALLAVAALFESWRMVRRQPGPNPATLPLTVLAAASAVAASLFGWLLSEYEEMEGSLVELHKWVGLGASVVALLAAGAAVKAASCPVSLKILRGALFLGTLGVLTTGYLGGEMVFGKNHLFSVFDKPKVAPPSNGDGKEPILKVTDKVDFETQIAPIIKASCLKCHGGEKTKAKLKLDTRENAMKGGESGKCIIPNDPAKSCFYTSLIEKDEDLRMPEKAKPLPQPQIDLIKKWIEQGAPWPDGFEIK